MATSSSSNSGSIGFCSICFDTFDIQTMATLRDCPHTFHYNCIKRSIVRVSPYCPLCRQPTRLEDIKKLLIEPVPQNQQTEGLIYGRQSARPRGTSAKAQAQSLELFKEQNEEWAQQQAEFAAEQTAMAEAMAREQAEAAEELRRLAEENASWTQRSMQGQLNWAGFLERERQENAAIMAKTQAEMASEIRRQQNEAEFLRQLAEGEAKLAEQAAQEQLMQIESELMAQIQDQDDNYPYVRHHH